MFEPCPINREFFVSATVRTTWQAWWSRTGMRVISSSCRIRFAGVFRHEKFDAVIVASDHLQQSLEIGKLLEDNKSCRASTGAASFCLAVTTRFSGATDGCTIGPAGTAWWGRTFTAFSATRRFSAPTTARSTRRWPRVRRRIPPLRTEDNRYFQAHVAGRIRNWANRPST